MKARVFNRHSLGFTHEEMFKGNMIKIPANTYVLMDYEDAVDFKGQFFNPKVKPTGEPDPAGWKMIEIVPITGNEPELKKYVCQLDGREFNTEAELNAYTKANYGTVETVKDEIIDAAINRKRGRPPKVTTHDELETNR